MEMDELYLDVFHIPASSLNSSFQDPSRKKKKIDFHPSHEAHGKQMSTKEILQDESSVDIYGDLSMDSIPISDSNLSSGKFVSSSVVVKHSHHSSPQQELVERESNISSLDLFTDVLASDLADKEKLNNRLKEVELRNNKLQEENKALKETKEQLSKNISSLFVTSRRELLKKAEELKIKEEEIIKLKKTIEKEKRISRSPSTSKLASSDAVSRQSSNENSSLRNRSKQSRNNVPMCSDSQRDNNSTRQHINNRHKDARKVEQGSEFESEKIDAPVCKHNNKPSLSNSKPMPSNKYTVTETVVNQHNASSISRSTLHKDSKSEIRENSPAEKGSGVFDLRSRLKRKLSDSKGNSNEQSLDSKERKDSGPKRVSLSGKHTQNEKDSFTRQTQRPKEYLPPVLSKGEANSKLQNSNHEVVVNPKEKKYHSEIRDRLQHEINQSYSLSTCQGVAARRKSNEQPVPCQNFSDKGISKFNEKKDFKSDSTAVSLKEISLTKNTKMTKADSKKGCASLDSTFKRRVKVISAGEGKLLGTHSTKIIKLKPDPHTQACSQLNEADKNSQVALDADVLSGVKCNSENNFSNDHKHEKKMSVPPEQITNKSDEILTIFQDQSIDTESTRKEKIEFDSQPSPSGDSSYASSPTCRASASRGTSSSSTPENCSHNEKNVKSVLNHEPSKASTLSTSAVSDKESSSALSNMVLPFVNFKDSIANSRSNINSTNQTWPFEVKDTGDELKSDKIQVTQGDLEPDDKITKKDITDKLQENEHNDGCIRAFPMLQNDFKHTESHTSLLSSSFVDIETVDNEEDENDDNNYYDLELKEELTSMASKKSVSIINSSPKTNEKNCSLSSKHGKVSEKEVHSPGIKSTAIELTPEKVPKIILQGPGDVVSTSNDSDRSSDHKSSSSQFDKNSNCSSATDSDKYSASSLPGAEDNAGKDSQNESKPDSILKSIEPAMSHTSAALSYATNITCTSNLIVLGDEETTCTTFTSPFKSHHLPSEFYPPGVRGRVKEEGSHARHIRGGTEVIRRLSVELLPPPHEPIAVLQNTKTNKRYSSALDSSASTNLVAPAVELDESEICSFSAVTEREVPLTDKCKDDVTKVEKRETNEGGKGEARAKIHLKNDKTDSFESRRSAHQDWVSKTFEDVFKKDIPSFKQEMASKSESSKKMLLKNLQNSELLKEHSKTKSMVKHGAHIDDINHSCSGSGLKEISQATMKQSTVSDVENLKANKLLKSGSIRSRQDVVDVTATQSKAQDSIFDQTYSSNSHGGSGSIWNAQDKPHPPKKVCKFVFKAGRMKSGPASPMPHQQKTPTMAYSSSSSSTASLKESSRKRKNPTPTKIEKSRPPSLYNRDLQSPSVGDDVIKDLVSSLGGNWQEVMEQDLSLDSVVSVNETSFQNSINVSCSASQPAANVSTPEKQPHFRDTESQNHSLESQPINVSHLVLDISSNDKQECKRSDPHNREISDHAGFASVFPKPLEQPTSKQSTDERDVKCLNRVSPQNCMVTSSDYQSEYFFIDKNCSAFNTEKPDVLHDHEPDSTSDPPSTGDINFNSQDLNLSFEARKSTDNTNCSKQSSNIISPDSPTKEPRGKAPLHEKGIQQLYESPQKKSLVLQSSSVASIPLPDQLSLSDEYTSEEEEESRLSEIDQKRVFDWCQSVSENSNALGDRSSSGRISSLSLRSQELNEYTSPSQCHPEDTHRFHSPHTSDVGFHMPEKDGSKANYRYFKETDNSNDMGPTSRSKPSSVKLQQKIRTSPVKQHDEISMIEASLSEFDNDFFTKESCSTDVQARNPNPASSKLQQSQRIKPDTKEHSGGSEELEVDIKFQHRFSLENSEHKINPLSQICTSVGKTTTIEAGTEKKTLKRRTKLKPDKILSRHLTFQKLKEMKLVTNAFIYTPDETDSEYSSESDEAFESQLEESQKMDKVNNSTEKYASGEEDWKKYEASQKSQFLSDVKKVTKKLNLNLEGSNGNSSSVMQNSDMAVSSPPPRQVSNDSELNYNLNINSDFKNKQNQPINHLHLTDVSERGPNSEQRITDMEDGEIMATTFTKDRNTVKNDRLVPQESRGQTSSEKDEIEEGEISDSTIDSKIETFKDGKQGTAQSVKDAKLKIQSKRHASVKEKATKAGQPADQHKRQEVRKLVHIGGGTSTCQYIEFSKKDDNSKKNLKLLRNRKKIFSPKIVSGHRVSPLDLVHEPDTKSYETEEIDSVFSQTERKRRPPLQLNRASKFQRSERDEKVNFVAQREDEVRRRISSRHENHRSRSRQRKRSRDRSKERNEQQTGWTKNDRGSSGNPQRNLFQSRTRKRSRDLNRERNKSRDRAAANKKIEGRKYQQERNFSRGERRENDWSLSGRRPSKKISNNDEKWINTDHRPSYSQSMHEQKNTYRTEYRPRAKNSISSPEYDRYSKSQTLRRSLPSKSSVSVVSHEINQNVKDSDEEMETLNVQESYPASEDELKSDEQDEFGYFSDERSPSPQLLDEPQERKYDSSSLVP